MVGCNGDGEVIDGLVCICIVVKLSTEIIRVTGGESGLTGVCTGAITTTRDLGGSGADTVALVATSTGCAFCKDGMAADGIGFEVIGTFGVNTTTTTVITGEHAGPGVVSRELACINTD